MTIAESLARFRREYRLNKTKAANAAGIKPASYTYEDSGGSLPNAGIITKLAKTFNVSTDYLLGLTDDPRPVNEILAAVKTAESKPVETSSRLDAMAAAIAGLQAQIDELKASIIRL